MNTAEIKLDILRRIDKLNEKQLKKIYHQLVQLLDISEYKLSDQENKAIDDALAREDTNEYSTTNDVVKEAKQKFQNLKFK